MATSERIQSLNVLLDGSSDGKMLLKEAYDGVIANVQKGTISSKIKNTDLSGDPTTGTLEAKRFTNTASQAYGTARSGGAGQKNVVRPVVIPINVDRELIHEVEEKDTSAFRKAAVRRKSPRAGKKKTEKNA